VSVLFVPPALLVPVHFFLPTHPKYPSRSVDGTYQLGRARIEISTLPPAIDRIPLRLRGVWWRYPVPHRPFLV